ncbi:MFS transporter [Rhizobium straminoryzae]|uniref:MFS transporter n=1 Tax=Rhizobium straminoryzae TaxID=1387186 RepID=A0A549SM16_9HYPH|nr:MFS transporter [Rhizobium straminoryzae]TRL30671.1 MFS transporter [Rhizobium straminoryzae]
MPAFLPRARLIAVLSLTQIIGWGTGFDMVAVIGPRMGAEIGLSNAVIFGGLTVMMVVSGLAGPSVGRMLARHGAARVLAMGSAWLGLGLLLLSACHHLFAYAATWVVLGWGGAQALSTPAYAAIVEREGAAGKRVIALTMIFTGLSATVFWPVNAWLADWIGWRDTLLVLAGLQFFVCLPLHLFALPKAQPQMAEAIGAAQAPVTLSEGDRRLAFLLVAASTTIAAFVSFGFSPTLLELLQKSGASPALALQLGAARGVIGISARAVDFAFGRRGSPLLTALTGTLCMLASFLLLALLPGTSPVLIGFVVLYSLGSGIMAVARAVLPLAVFSPQEYGLQSARISLPQNMAIAAGPLAFAALMDAGGTLPALLVASLLVGLSILLLVRLGKLVRDHRRDVPPGLSTEASA